MQFLYSWVYTFKPKALKEFPSGRVCDSWTILISLHSYHSVFAVKLCPKMWWVRCGVLQRLRGSGKNLLGWSDWRWYKILFDPWELNLLDLTGAYLRGANFSLAKVDKAGVQLLAPRSCLEGRGELKEEATVNGSMSLWCESQDLWFHLYNHSITLLEICNSSASLLWFFQVFIVQWNNT